MDIEFHYYMTYLIAARAGMGPEDAYTVAYSSQYVDDNDTVFAIDKGGAQAYGNYISQTMNILKPKAKLFRIYPLFHFIPGDPQAKSAVRKDGKMHWLNTTPDSVNANRVIDSAIDSNNLYRIGVACHGYVDTWAHQNFTGYYDAFNAMSGPLSLATPNIGHADAGHNPDWPALVWKDKRLLGPRVDNRSRFLDAAERLLEKLLRYCHQTVTDRSLAEQRSQLRADLDDAIGPRDQSNALRDQRIERYTELSQTPPYGGRRVMDYDEFDWFEQAVDEEVRGLRDRSDHTLTRWDPLTDRYSWKNGTDYRRRHWYLFQQAVKEHQNESWDILSQSNLKGLELPEL
ncbi:MAG: DUF6765 family protein [Candidatus Binatia bacterium]